MKIKKLIKIVAVIMAGALLVTSCTPGTGKDDPSDESLFEIKAFDIDDNPVEFKNGDTHVDPTKISYFEFKFKREMDKNYYDFTSNFWDFTNYAYWENSYTYILEAYFLYGKEYHFTLNDYTYAQDNNSNYTVKDSFWREKNGNTIPETRISFSTKKQPSENVNYVIDGTYFDKDWHIELKENEYGKNMQTFISLERCFNHRQLRKGDTVTFNIDVIPDSDIPPVFVNLVDDSYSVNYWKPLANKNNEPVDLELTTEPMNEGQTYSVSVKFTITEDQVTNCKLYFTSDDYDGDGEKDGKFWDKPIGLTLKTSR